MSSPRPSSIPEGKDGDVHGPDKFPHKNGVTFFYHPEEVGFTLMRGGLRPPPNLTQYGFVVGYANDHYRVRITGMGDFSVYKTKLNAIRDPLWGKIPMGPRKELHNPRPFGRRKEY